MAIGDNILLYSVDVRRPILVITNASGDGFSHILLHDPGRVCGTEGGVEKLLCHRAGGHLFGVDSADPPYYLKGCRNIVSVL